MTAIALIIGTLIGASVVGFICKRNEGRFKAKKNFHPLVSRDEVGGELGSSATVLQFSSAFCAPCRTTRSVLESVVPSFVGVKHVEIDAEKNLDLVRRLKVASTPTTIFLDRNGQELGRAVGAPKKSQVVAVLEKI